MENTENKRLKNTFSMLLNLSIVILSIMSLTYAFRSDIVVEDAFFNFKGFTSFRFFTNLSNLYVAVASLVMLKSNIKNAIYDTYEFPVLVSVLKFSATVAVSVTFVIVVIFLSPLVALGGRSYFTLFANNSFILHFLTPVLAIVSHMFFEEHKSFRFSFTLLGVVPTFMYSIVYLVMVVFIGESNGGWPDFYYFTFGGKLWAIPITMSLMYLLTFGLSVLLWFIQKKVQQKSLKVN